MTAVGAPLRLGGLALLDLERAQPPGLPAAAVQLQRHARLAARSTAASIRPATPGCRRRASRIPRVLFGETAPTGYDVGQRPPRSSRALLHPRGAAGVPARSAVPERATTRKPSSCSELQIRLRPPRLHAMPPGPTTFAAGTPTTSRSACSRDSPTRSTWPRDAHAIPTRPADLPDRVRGAEQAEQVRSASRSHSRPNTTRSPNRSPGQTRAWPPSRSTCCGTTRSAARPERARTAARSASRRGWSTSTARPSRSTTAGRCR